MTTVVDWNKHKSTNRPGFAKKKKKKSQDSQSLMLRVDIFCQFLAQKLHLSYDVASEREIKPWIKNDKPLVDYICKLVHMVMLLSS